MALRSAEVSANFLRAVRREGPGKVPVAACISSQYICKRSGVNVSDYLYDPRLKLEVQCSFQDEHPELLLVPGIYPDFGCGVVEPSAFGCRLVQREDNPLSPEPVCPQALRAEPGARGIEELLARKSPDPERAGLLPRVLDQYRYFWRHLDRRYIERYGYLDGFAFAMGPVETAALVVGYENFLLGLHDFPRQIHRLLERMTEFSIAWLKTQEALNGRLKRIYLFDHMPARMGPEHFEQFAFPYLSRVCAQFSYALKIFHICEKRIAHVLGRIAELGIDVLFFSADIAEVKKAAGGRVCLMGNLSPIELILRGSPPQIAEEARRCIAMAAEREGGYILAPGGAFIPGTPAENIRALVEAVEAQRPSGVP
jgi:uroporphyrinogen decarboxylase